VTAEDFHRQGFRYRWAAEDWHAAENPTGLMEEPEWIVGAASVFRDRMIALSRECKVAQVISVASHGSVGRLHFGSDRLDLNGLKNWRGLSCAVAPNARISLAGCEVGRGCRGHDFMLGLADALLRGKGGQVQAHNHLAVAGARVMRTRSIDGQVNRLTVNSSFGESRFEPPAPRAQACMENIQEVEARVTQLMSLFPSACTIPLFERQMPLSEVKTDLLNRLARARASYRRFSDLTAVSRVMPAGRHDSVAGRVARVFSDIAYVRNQVLRVGPTCPPEAQPSPVPVCDLEIGGVSRCEAANPAR
jgi:hypothetical protein